MLVSPLPQLAWHRVSDLCSRTVVPVYNALRTTLHDDVEGLAQLFVDLEVTSERGSQAYFEVSFFTIELVSLRSRVECYVLRRAEPTLTMTL